MKKRTLINAPAEDVFKWHEREGALQRLSPPWDPIKVIEYQGGIDKGSEVVLVMNAGPIPYKWHAIHTEYIENSLFRDIQVKGPFSEWVHSHKFEPSGTNSSWLEDSIEYKLPFHPISKFIFGRFIKKKLKHIFTYRHRITSDDIGTHGKYKNIKPLKIMISGASGLIGSTLIPFLTTGGHMVHRLVRRPPVTSKGEIFWNPAENILNPKAFEDIDCVIHLSGESIAEGRWTEKKKKSIIESRIKSTALIAETIANMKSPPKVFISASATGYYGDRGDSIITEEDEPGSYFVSKVCHDWEKAAEPAIGKGIRTAFLRIGAVLTPEGGALQKLLPSFQLGMGGKIASGNQYMSWICIDDVIGAIHHIVMDNNIEGPVNLVAPEPVTNRELTKTLGKVLARPALFTIPAFAIMLLFGEMGNELLLSSTRVKPAKLIDSGYRFKFPELDETLLHLLGKNKL